MNAQATLQTYTIGAGLTRNFDFSGSKFWLVNTTGTLEVTFDDKGVLEMTSGMRLQLVDGDIFRRIRIKNPDTSSTVTFSFYAGDLDISSVSPVVFFKPAPAYFVPYTYSVAQGADTIPPVTNLRAGKTVADTLSHVVISNNDATSLHVRDLAGTVGLVVPSGEIVQLTLTQQFYLRSAAAGPITVRVMLFYNFDS